MEFVQVNNGAISLRVAVAGSGPLILCVHGWPELWYSWRHQIEFFAARGFKVAALDVRGYGGSSRPPEVDAYRLSELCADVAAVIEQLGNGRCILFGHDWGSPIAWHTALLYPERVEAIALHSVPYFPRSDTSIFELWEALYPDRFFYQLYFQDPVKPEQELERDVTDSLAKIYCSISGDVEPQTWIKEKPRDAGLLDGLVRPDPLPDWLTAHDLEVYSEAFRKSGFRGPINRYRAQDLDREELGALIGVPLEQPSCFIGGDLDAVRYFVEGVDSYANPGQHCTDFRGKTIIPRVGHWVQQEAPEATNQALAAFLEGL